MDENLIKQIATMVIEKLKEDKLYERDYTKVPVGVSNRHVHLSKEDLEVLFGKGYELTKKNDLKQPGQFASNETVTIRGKKGQFEKVRILGPVRPKTQVEISITDGFRLGIKPPIKESGKLSNTPGLEIIGPKGSIHTQEGTIVALRHIHMSPEHAKALGLKDKDIVAVEVNGERQCILGKVLIRVTKEAYSEMHIDLDEANACALKNNDLVTIRTK